MVRVDNGCSLSHLSNKIAIPCEITWKAHFVSSKHLSCARRTARHTCRCRHTYVYGVCIDILCEATQNLATGTHVNLYLK